MSFEQNIKKWVSIDNEIKEINSNLKCLRDNKNELTNEIITYASDNNLTNRVIEITGGNIKSQNKKETSPLTFKFIKNCLLDCISNEDQVDIIINYIKEKRDIKYISELKRAYNN